MSEVKGIELVKVSPAYTSQTCSKCGHVDEKSRNGEHFSCTCCGYQIDADYNAAINIHNRGVYSLSNQPIHYFS
jgi:transposase